MTWLLPVCPVLGIIAISTFGWLATRLTREHDARGQLARAYHSEALDHPWTWSYDQRGRLTAANQPSPERLSSGLEIVTPSRGSSWSALK